MTVSRSGVKKQLSLNMEVSHISLTSLSTAALRKAAESVAGRFVFLHLNDLVQSPEKVAEERFISVGYTWYL